MKYNHLRRSSSGRWRSGAENWTFRKRAVSAFVSLDVVNYNWRKVFLTKCMLAASTDTAIDADDIDGVYGRGEEAVYFPGRVHSSILHRCYETCAPLKTIISLVTRVSK